MKQYKVIALSVGGSGNRIFKAGDTLNENAFPEGHAERYVKSGHLACLENTEDEHEPFQGREFSEWKIKEIKDFLKENEVEFDSKSNKASLYPLMFDVVIEEI